MGTAENADKESVKTANVILGVKKLQTGIEDKR